MKKTLLGIFLLLLFVSFSSAQPLDESGQWQMPLVIRIDTYADGSQSVSYLPVDPDTGKALHPDPFVTRIAEASAVKLQPAVLTRSLHWDWPVIITFDVTKDSKLHKAKVNKIMNKYHNKRRGNSNTPRMKITNNVVEVKPQANFPNPWEYYNQLDRDGHHTVVMTADDQFFKDPLGFVFDPEIVSTTKLFAFANLIPQGNRWIGTYWITEVDVYLVYGFFSVSKNTYFRLGTPAFRMGLGYQSTVWSHDYLSSRERHVSAAAFKNAGSTVWTDISHVRDDFYYMDKLGDTWTPNYLNSPRLLPFEDEVLDIGDYDLPWLDENGNIHLEKSPILFVTNLKGFDGNKKMVGKVFRVTDDTPPQDVKLVTLRGNTLRYPEPAFGKNFYASIFLNHVRLGREKDLNKLLNAVNQYGTPQLIDGVDFAKALRIKVTVTGYLTDKGQKGNLTRLFWLVDIGK
jgi:hypothetical protein